MPIDVRGDYIDSPLCDGSTTTYQPDFSLDINSWVSNGFQIPILLSQYWDCFPPLKWAILSFGVSQCVICIVGLAFVGIRVNAAYKKGHGFWDGTTAEQEFERLGGITIPIMIMIWQFFLGLMYITLPLVGLCSTSMTWILAHVWMEFPIFIMRFFLFRGNGVIHKQEMAKLSYALLTIAGVDAFLFMSTSNSRIQGILAGLAGPADFGNLLSIYLCVKMKDLYSSRMLAGCAKAEMLIMALSIHHVISFYGPIAFYWELYANGMFLVVTAAINQVLLATFVGIANKTLTTMVATLPLTDLEVSKALTSSTNNGTNQSVNGNGVSSKNNNHTSLMETNNLNDSPETNDDRSIELEKV